ncbi:hypothetical protein HPB48_009975 [Haemaphysalis longicornis]|uniref:Endonuclease/exonuclease/phosphatase domain-containing protein n=1 Tax=Haemaphysalis longicornis TaxID=44386 RepID=A0A9J6FZU7_HAELO|nr:hypothetical protein HPB48_009975 [Haemaphysalis longicornis]
MPGAGICFFVEILPATAKKQKLYVLNVYSAPRLYRNVGFWLQMAHQVSHGHSLVIVGDFGAPHPAWRYPQPTRKSQQVFDTLQQLNLSILTDPAHPTRQGNRVQRNTTPDLSIVKNVNRAQ